MIFEITEAELDELEQASSGSLHQNLGIASISIAVSFLIALLTTTIDDLKTFCVFVILCVVGFLAGITFCLLWWRSSKQLKNVAGAIRDRILPETIQENVAPENKERT